MARQKKKDSEETIVGGLPIEALESLMKRLTHACGYCGSASWAYEEKIEIAGNEYLRYVCMSCKESFRNIRIDHLMDESKMT